MKTGKQLHAESENFRTPRTVVNEGVVVVNLNFELMGLDRGAEAILKGLAGCDLNGGLVSIPAEIRGMLETWSPSETPSMKMNLSVGNLDYSCRVFLLQPLNGMVSQALFAIHLNREASLRDALNEVAEDYHLTDREREVLGGLSLGLTSRALAKRMDISPNTVNAFLRMIMIKMAVTTRAGIVGKLLEQDSVEAGGGVHGSRRRGVSD